MSMYAPANAKMKSLEIVRAPFLRMAVVVLLTALLGVIASDASARGRGRPQINRSGPASQGSFSRPASTYRRRAPAPDPGPDRMRERGRDPGPDRMRERGRDPGPDRMRERGRDPGPDRDPPPRRVDSVVPENVRDDRIENRVDRRDDALRHRRRHRGWRRGTQLTYVEWNDNDCRNDEVVVNDDSLFECNGTWFVQTYYGGDVVYTVTDPPRGS